MSLLESYILIVSFQQSQLFCWLLDLWSFTLQTCHTLLLLIFQVFNRLRNFSCWSLDDVMYCDHNKALVVQQSIASSLHCSLSRGWLHTAILICYYNWSMNAYMKLYMKPCMCVLLLYTSMPSMLLPQYVNTQCCAVVSSSVRVAELDNNTRMHAK